MSGKIAKLGHSLTNDGKVRQLSKALTATTYGKKIIDKCREILNKLANSNTRFFRDRYMLQHPGMYGYAPHQELFAGSGHRTNVKQIYNVNIAITPQNEKTGCLWGRTDQKLTNDLGFCTTKGCSIGKNCICAPESNTITADIMRSKYSLEPIPTESGDCLFFDGYFLHGTALNEGNKVRKNLILQFREINKNEMH